MSMSQRRIISTLQLQDLRDLEALDIGVRDLLQTPPNVPCNALLTAGYTLFKRDCLQQICSGSNESRANHVLGRGFSLQLHSKQVLFCFTPHIFNLPEKEEKACPVKK